MNDNNRILIIDDNVSIHEDFRKILTPHKTTSESLDKMNAMLVGTKQLARLPDFELSFASQGEQGVEMIQAALDEKRPYALTFVDVQMPPGIDGVETIAKIWKMDLNIQAVICTAYSKYSWVDLQKVFGDSERLFVLKKPFDNIEVIQLAIALTRRWNINRAIRQQLAIVNSLPTDPKSDKGRAEGFNRLKESIENLARLTSKMKGPS